MGELTALAGKASCLKLCVCFFLYIREAMGELTALAGKAFCLKLFFVFVFFVHTLSLWHWLRCPLQADISSC